MGGWVGKTEKEGKEKKIHQGFLDFSASANCLDWGMVCLTEKEFLLGGGGRMSEDQVFVDNLFQIAKMSFTFGFYFEDFKEFQPEN